MKPCISPKARIGKNVRIGQGSIVHDGVRIGDNTMIQELCVIGLPHPGIKEPLVIGKGAQIRSHTILYQGS